MTEQQLQKSSLWGSSRLALTIVGFFGFINLYALRVDMSVAIVCMTRQGGTSINSTISCNKTDSGYTAVNDTRGDDVIPCRGMDDDYTFDWDKKTQGLILGSFFWGYIVTQIPGGWLAGKYGGKQVFGWSMFLCAVATLLTPWAAQTSITLLMILRVIAGLCQGVVWPCMQMLFSYWAPPLERSQLSGFVYAGGLGVIWFVVWTFVVYDSPLKHPRISDKEKNHIVTSLKRDIDVTKKTVSTPWKEIFTSLPVWAIIVTHACANWGTYTFMTNIPSYMKDVLHFDIKKAGFLSALPYIGFWAMTNVSGQLADLLRKKGLVTTTTARKIFNSLGTLAPAVFIIITGHLDGNPGFAVAMLTIGVAMSGCQYGSGFIVNPVDIAPRYAGVIFGISNTTGTLGGFLAPIAIGIITVDKTREQWQIVFYIAAAIYTVGALFYIAFGSGEVQSWALDTDNDQELEVNLNAKSEDNEDETQI
ncbi:hypothetical protein ACF0H5_008917 [Mactra antiquata]